MTTDVDSDEGEASEGDVGVSDPAVAENDWPVEMTRTWFSRLLPALLALVSVVVNEVRTSGGLSKFLIDDLWPATQIASQHNPLLDHLGFPSGSELTAVSLPLRLYAVFGALGFGPISATNIMVAIEVVWLFVAIAWAVRIIQPSVPRAVAAAVATVGTIGYTLDGNNLANFPLFFGWNYGFAYGLACLAIAFALRRRWTASAAAISALVAVHFVVSVLVGLVVLPLVALDLAQRRFDIRRLPTVAAGCCAGVYLWLARGDVQLPTASLDTKAYIARLRAFQYHLFYEFDLRWLRYYAEDIGAWSLAAVVVLAAALTARRRGHLAPSNRIAIVLASTAVLSMIGWAHSTLDAPNITLLVMGPHRSSMFVNLLLLTFALPLFLCETRTSRRTALPVCLVLWCMVRNVDLHLTFGLVLLGLATLWIVGEVRQRPDRNSFGLALLAFGFAIPAGYFLGTAAADAGPGNLALARIAMRQPATLLALVLILVLVLVQLTSGNHRRAPSAAITAALAVIPVVLVLGTSALANPRPVSGAKAQVATDLIDTASWARGNTAKDAIFMLPFDDYGFGWTMFSERSSAGKPREWLHYAFLYSRSQTVMDEGTRRAELLGIDVDVWLRDHPQLGVGVALVNELTERFNRLTDRSIARLGDQLDVDYYIFDRSVSRDLGCFKIVHENQSFEIAVATAECSG